MRSTIDNENEFKVVCQLIANHCKGSDTPEQTLNRLFKKHLKRKPEISNDPPILSDQNTEIIKETRTKLSFVGLARDLESGPRNENENPIVIVRYREVDCLIDGSHRCRQWYKTEDTGTHTAYVLIVHNETKSVTRV